MKLFFAESYYDIAKEFKRRYETQLQEAYKDAVALLPTTSPHINFFVQPRDYDLIDVTQDNAKTHNTDFIELAFNPTLDEQGLNNIIANVRPTVFHEVNHAARWNVPIWHETFIDSCIMEGLANVFAREHAGEKAPWADYSQHDVKAWLEEIRNAGDDLEYGQYMFQHADGRRWIGYKVGTYIVDEAMKNSGNSIVELTSMECADIVKIAAV